MGATVHALLAVLGVVVADVALHAGERDGHGDGNCDAECGADTGLLHEAAKASSALRRGSGGRESAAAYDRNSTDERHDAVVVCGR